MKKHYIIAKSNYDGEVVVIDYNKIDGYKVMPKNDIKYPGVKINYLIIIKPSFIEKVLKKKVKIKLDYYLKYFIAVIDDDSDSDSRKALGELERFKETIEYKYRKYLDDKYINLLLKKVSLLEKEIKSKVVYQKLREEKQTIYEKPVETRRRSR